MNYISNLFTAWLIPPPPERFIRAGFGWTPHNAIEDAYRNIKREGHTIEPFESYKKDGIYTTFVTIDGARYRFITEKVGVSEFFAHLEQIR